MGSTVCFVVVIRITAEIAGTFGNWEPSEATVGNWRNRMCFLECKYEHKVVAD